MWVASSACQWASLALARAQLHESLPPTHILKVLVGHHSGSSFSWAESHLHQSCSFKEVQISWANSSVHSGPYAGGAW